MRSGNSSTALAAIGALLTSSKGWATSGDMGQVLARLRTLPWERTAVMREVSGRGEGMGMEQGGECNTWVQWPN